MNKFLISIILTMVLFIFTNDATAKKKLYKWVDENGNISYSDQVPPDQIKKEHEELSDSGVVIDKVANIKTGAERKADREAKLHQIELAKQAKLKEKERLNIIKAYSNESEITRLQDERLSALERNIELAGQSLEFQKISRDQLLSMAAGNERSGIEISKALLSRIKIVEEKIAYQIKFIDVKQAEVNKVKQKFANDIRIYREATGAK